MRRLAARATAAVLVLSSLAFAAPTAATTLVLPDGTANPQPYQSWVDHAQVPTLPGTVTLNLASCPVGSAACADPGDSRIYLDPTVVKPASPFHELGHIFDGQFMTASGRH